MFSELRKYQLEAEGEEVSMILSNDFLPSFGNVIVTSDRLLSENPDLVKRFTDAVTASYEWVIDGHIEDALNISIEKYTPAAADQLDYLKTAFENTFVASVWQSPLTAERGLGAANLEAWQQAADTMVEYEVIAERPLATDFVVDPSQIGN